MAQKFTQMDLVMNQDDQNITDTMLLMSIMDKTEMVGTHLEWRGSLDTAGIPVTRRPGERKLTAVRRIIFELNGTDPTGKLATYKCTNTVCLCHITLLTRKQLQIRSAKTTNYARSPARRMAISKKRRETSKLTPVLVAEMRDRAQSMTTRQLGVAYGVAQSTAAAVVGHRTWRDYSNPFLGLMV
jgi:hypothetical protein